MSPFKKKVFRCLILRNFTTQAPRKVYLPTTPIKWGPIQPFHRGGGAVDPALIIIKILQIIIHLLTQKPNSTILLADLEKIHLSASGNITTDPDPHEFLCYQAVQDELADGISMVVFANALKQSSFVLYFLMINTTKETVFIILPSPGIRNSHIIFFQNKPMLIIMKTKNHFCSSEIHR